jgi:hypothetical protein
MTGIVEEALGVAGPLSAYFLIVLTSGPVLKFLTALAFLLAVAALLRLVLMR